MDILRKILAHKREEIAARKHRTPEARLRERVTVAPPLRGFARALQQRMAMGQPAVIAEIKRASPSQGLIRQDFNPAQHAMSYAQYGATCLSVLTDEKFFQGNDDHLRDARAACRLPVLRKDFTIDPYQVWESRALGADCILLIVAALTAAQLQELAALASELGLDVLVEVHTREELETALTLQAAVVGINNRDLKTFTIDLQTTISLLPHLPANRILVSESGIHTASEVAHLRQHGVQAFLIGESFMRQPDPGVALADLFGLQK